MKNNDNTYGCKLIQDMKQDINKLKKESFTIPCLVKIVLSLAGIIIFAFVVRSFIPSRAPEIINYNIVVDEANKARKTEIKTEMAEALVKVEERAVNAYNDKFATLLTVLTIFGIAWPVIVGSLQFKFNEKQIKEIDEAQQKISELSDVYIKTNLNMASSFEAIMNISVKDVANAKNEVGKSYCLYNFIVAFDNALNCYLEGNASPQKIANFMSATFYFLDKRKKDKFYNKTIDLLKKEIERKENFYSGKELKEHLGIKNIALYRKYRAFFIDLYPWKFDDDGE